MNMKCLAIYIVLGVGRLQSLCVGLSHGLCDVSPCVGLALGYIYFYVEDLWLELIGAASLLSVQKKNLARSLIVKKWRSLSSSRNNHCICRSTAKEFDEFHRYKPERTDNFVTSLNRQGGQHRQTYEKAHAPPRTIFFYSKRYRTDAAKR